MITNIENTIKKLQTYYDSPFPVLSVYLEIPEEESIKEYENTIVKAVEKANPSVITVHRERIRKDDTSSLYSFNVDDEIGTTQKQKPRTLRFKNKILVLELLFPKTELL